MRYRLSDCVDIISGGTPKKSISEYWNGNIPWITIRDFNSKYPKTVNEYITEEGLEHSAAKLSENKDILISARGTVGEVMMVHEGYTFNQSIYGLRVKKDIAIPEYIYYWLVANKEIFAKNVHGSVFDTITRKTFDHIQIELPNIADQLVIVHKLNSIDSKITINEAINTNLLELGLELISNINFKNYLPLNKIVEVKDGTHSSPASTLNGYPLVTSKAIKGTSVDFSQTKNISEADFTEINKRSLVEYHDILVSMIGTVGIVHLVTENPVKYAIKNVGLIKSSEKNILSPFLYLYLLSDYGQTYIKEHLSGSTQQFISLTSLRKMPIPISSNIPAKLIEELNAIVLKIEHNSNENNILNSIKNVLLEKYF